MVSHVCSPMHLQPYLFYCGHVFLMVRYNTQLAIPWGLDLSLICSGGSQASFPRGLLLFGSPEFVSFTPANDSWLGQRSYQGRSWCCDTNLQSQWILPLGPDNVISRGLQYPKSTGVLYRMIFIGMSMVNHIWQLKIWATWNNNYEPVCPYYLGVWLESLETSGEHQGHWEHLGFG